MLKGWQIAKINANRKKKPYKQMKDRDMTGINVVFSQSKPIQGKVDYYFDHIEPSGTKITINYIANLAGKRGISKRWTFHGGGGYVPYLTLNEEEFIKMQDEVKRLGGQVLIW